MPNPLIIMKEKFNVDIMLKNDKNISLCYTLVWAALSLYSLYNTAKLLINYLKLKKNSKKEILVNPS